MVMVKTDSINEPRSCNEILKDIYSLLEKDGLDEIEREILCLLYYGDVFRGIGWPTIVKKIDDLNNNNNIDLSIKKALKIFGVKIPEDYRISETVISIIKELIRVLHSSKIVDINSRNVLEFYMKR